MFFKLGITVEGHVPVLQVGPKIRMGCRILRKISLLVIWIYCQTSLDCFLFLASSENEVQSSNEVCATTTTSQNDLVVNEASSSNEVNKHSIFFILFPADLQQSDISSTCLLA